jgi:iron complex outermembrane receptor protein
MQTRSTQKKTPVSILALAIGWALQCSALAVSAQEPASVPAPEKDATSLEAVQVVGIRPSLQKAAELKKDASQVLDIITAEDVGKLPDDNVAEALQRVTGVQITRVFGEGQSVSIRGLPQVRVEVDGRTLLGWSAKLSPPENEQLGRNSGLDTVPSGLFGRLEVRKSPTAMQVEGGLGGSVNLVTPDPLDYKEPVFLARAKQTYSEGSDKIEPALSGLFARQFLDRRLGFLLGVDYVEHTSTIQAFERNDFFNAAFDLNRDGVRDVSGDRIHYEQFSTDRTRSGVTFEAEFKASDQLTLKSEFMYSEMKTDRRQNFIAWRYAGKPVTNAVFQDNVIVAGDSTGTLQQAGLHRKEPTDSFIGALSANWRGERVTFDADLSYSEGNLDQTIEQITLDSINRNIPGRFDYRAGKVPSLDLGTFDPANPANYRAVQVRANRLKGKLDETVGKFDVRFIADWGDLRNLYFGVRARELGATSVATRTQLAPDPAEIVPFLTTTGNGLLSDIDGSFPRNFLTTVADSGWILQRVGGYPLQPNSARDYDLTEKSTAAYVMAEFEGEAGTWPYRANAGVRVIDTRLDVDTFLQVSSQAALIPVNDRNSYRNVLPSANIVFYPSQDLLLRFALSKTMQQAGIAELAPSIFVNQTNRSATGGNASLEPTVARQADMSMEYYFSSEGLLSFAMFYKDVKDLIAQQTVLQAFPGFEDLGPIPYTRPANIGDGKVKGFEAGFQRFFDKLPAPFDGLGLIANYTYSDAKDNLGQPMVGVSKNSFNLIGLYEKGRFSARLAYNKRDKAAFSFTEGRPNFVAGISQLDLQLGWKLSDRFSVQFIGSNLMPKDSATVEYSDIGPIALNSYALSERRFSIGVSAKF